MHLIKLLPFTTKKREISSFVRGIVKLEERNKLVSHLLFMNFNIICILMDLCQNMWNIYATINSNRKFIPLAKRSGPSLLFICIINCPEFNCWHAVRCVTFDKRSVSTIQYYGASALRLQFHVSTAASYTYYNEI